MGASGRKVKMMRIIACAALVAIAAAIPTMEFDHAAYRQIMIDEINSAPNVTWKAASNPRFHGMPVGASKTMCGVIGDWKADIEEAIGRGEVIRFEGVAEAAIPDEFDSATHWPKCAKTINDI